MQIYGVPADVAEKETHPIENNGTVLFFQSSAQQGSDVFPSATH